MSLKASISGIRGIVGESLTPPILVDYVSAFSAILGEGPILLGRDSRPSGVYISSLVKAVLNSLGRDVVDIEIVPTPTVLFGVKEGDFAGGIVVTASHNPIEWNALKLVNGEGKFLSPSQFQQLSEVYKKKDFHYVRHSEAGSSSLNRKIPVDHLEKIIDFTDYQSIRQKRFKVAVDTVNGAGGTHAIRFLEALDCEVVPIHTEETGIFAHPPEPTPANLSDLSQAVRESGAQVGFALDPDGDRLVIADSKGEILSEEYTLALAINYYLTYHGKSDVVVNNSTSSVTADTAKSLGARVYRVPTGEIHVTEKLEAINAAIGGEGNGGVILRSLNKCRDAFVGMALILDLLARSGQTIEELAGKMPRYSLIKKKYGAENIDFNEIEKVIQLEFKNESVDNQDGLRIDWDDKWVLIRKSNTEPIIRIFGEAKSEETALELIESVKKIAGI